MTLPLVLLILSGVSAGLVAYGNHPFWMRFGHGLEMTVFSRQYQWPVAAFAVLMCLSLISLAIAGKRRVWWLVGLGPVLALFAHRVYHDPFRHFQVLENPTFVSADQAKFMQSDDWVVGIVFEGTAWTYPYWAIYGNPVVLQSVMDKRLMLIWSPLANRAAALRIGRELHARDLEIVGMPGNALLVYNSKVGQFINGITALTHRGEAPLGVGHELTVVKMRWIDWLAEAERRKLPVRVLSVPADPSVRQQARKPVLPAYPMPGQPVRSPTRIILIATTRPAAISALEVTSRPANLKAGASRLLVFRDPNNRIRVFDRRTDEDLFPTFETNRRRDAQAGAFVDRDTGSEWNHEGLAIRGQLKGARLAALRIEEDLYLEVMKFWMPQIELLKVPPGR